MRREMDAQERQQTLADLPDLVFRDMLQELLLQSRAQQLAVTVSDAQIDGGIAQMKQSFGITTEEEYQAALAQSGLTEPQLREQLRDNFRVREVMDREVRSRIKLNEEDLRRYYRKNAEEFRAPEQLHLREVVVLEESGLSTAEERAKTAAEIRQAAAGKSLADVITTYRDMGVTSNVIDLGWVSQGDLDPSLESAAWKLKPGEVTEPIAGRGGLHLMQVVERRESRIPPFSEVSAAIEAREQNRAYNEEVVKYMAELEKKSLVVADPPQEAAGFRRLLQQPEPTDEDTMLGDLVRPNRAAAPAPATPTQAAPGALPQPKPMDTTPPPVMEPPTAEPPPAEPSSPPPGV